jgi:hypothetical protein
MVRRSFEANPKAKPRSRSASQTGRNSLLPFCRHRIFRSNIHGQAHIVRRADELDWGRSLSARRWPVANHGIPACVHQSFRWICNFRTIGALDRANAIKGVPNPMCPIFSSLRACSRPIRTLPGFRVLSGKAVTRPEPRISALNAR